MSNTDSTFTKKQLLFKELFVGTLIFAVVLGFFNDYTSIVYAKSFSSIFLASVVLELLTYLAFMLKDAIIGQLKGNDGAFKTAMMFFCVWMVMFLSKFVFVWAVDLIFGNNVNINGFFGILLVVLAVTVIHRLADYVFVKLGRE